MTSLPTMENPEPSARHRSHFLLHERSRVPRSSSAISVPDMKGPDPKLRVLIAANGTKDVASAQALVVRLSKHAKIETKAICDEVTPRLQQECMVFQNKEFKVVEKHGPDACIQRDQVEWFKKQAYELCEWADLLVVAPMDANTFAKMLHGLADDLLLEVIRGWDVSKKILLVPGMTTSMWENPMTKKQLNKIRRKWNWVRVMQPILWHFEDESNDKIEKCIRWDGFNELVDAIKNHLDLMTIGHDVDIATAGGADLIRANLKTDTILPPEIWSIIMTHVGDWEVAKSLGVYTTLPIPAEWRPSTRALDEIQSYMRELEWTILTSNTPTIIEKLAHAPSNMRWLSSLCVKLIIKFCLIDLLAHLETHFKDVFWASFGPTLLPTKASAVFGRTEILEWWRTSPSFLSKEYTSEALDGASKSGFVHVLDWWRKSGLPMKYTEAALEQASGKGHILVLEWWKEASMHQGQFHIESDTSRFGSSRSRHQYSSPTSKMPISRDSIPAHGPLGLMVGKSICAAAQNGQAAVIRWWDTSGIPYSHSETVAKVASAHGHVNVLETWKELKGEKMIFDSQVLVGPTKNGHVGVLEWWKNSGMKVEYKTCDIEEALEDSIGDGAQEDRVRIWWAKNGLNLGLGTSEWMKVKVL
jgi:hypothetical protein